MQICAESTEKYLTSPTFYDLMMGDNVKKISNFYFTGRFDRME